MLEFAGGGGFGDDLVLENILVDNGLIGEERIS